MQNPRISLIVAIGKDRAIGSDNKLLWHIKDDLKLFMRTTSQHVVIHGRKSFESIGAPLRNRTNIILTRDSSYSYSGTFICHSLNEAITLAKKLEQRDEIFILGGAQIYAQSLDIVDRMYISHVEGEFPQADAHFPEYDISSWNCIHSETYSKSDRNEFGFTFCIYERNRSWSSSF